MERVGGEAVSDAYEYCHVCRETVVVIPDRRSDATFWTCRACGHVCDWVFDEDELLILETQGANDATTE